MIHWLWFYEKVEEEVDWRRRRRRETC